MNSLSRSFSRTLGKKTLVVVISILLPIFGLSNPAIAAKEIRISYSTLELSLPISTLEKYARSGVIDSKFAVYQNYLPIKELERTRRVFLKPIKVNPEAAKQFLATKEGEFLLERLTELIKPESSQPQLEFSAWRSALIAASGTPEGLTILNLLRNYPKDCINIDILTTLKLAGKLERLISDTEMAIALIQQKSDTKTAVDQQVNLAELSNLAISGKWRVSKYVAQFFDSDRQRSLVTDIYIPDNTAQISHPAPLIIISHGLGLNSSNFRYLANYLAIHGFAVAVPNHPVSNTQYISSNEIISPGEFINRPLDVKYVLNQLETGNQSDSRWRGKLNLQQVGVLGQSFGGYTALALAGARLNFPQLKKDCQPDLLNNTWNMSLLLQCQALELPRTSQKNLNLQDKRVKAVIAINPVTSSIFGKVGLNKVQTPIMIVGSSQDTVAPALSEQILPFSWLTNPCKYLVMLIGATHFSTIGHSNFENTQITLSPDMVGNAYLARYYINNLSFAFFQTYVAEKPHYISYLNNSYIKTISSKTLGLSLVRSLNPEALAQIIHSHGQLAISRRETPVYDRQFWLLNLGYWCFLAKLAIFSVFLSISS